MAIAGTAILVTAASGAGAEEPATPGLPFVDLAAEKGRQVVVDREPGQYLGHPTTVLLEDGRTILCVYPKGHGKGAILYKRSDDGGKTWSDRLPTPASWETSLETPTIYRTVDRAGKKRLLLFSGLYPIRLSVSDDDGRSWSELRPIGPYGGIVAMAALTGDRQVLRYAPDGRLFATFRDQAEGSPTKGDWVGWVGRFEDIAAGRPGQYRVRLMKNHYRDDCAYPGLQLLPDGTFVATTYGHWTPGEPPYVVSVRFTLAELDARRGSPPGREP